MSLTRKFLFAVAALFVLVVAGLAVFLLTFDANRHRGLILAQLSRAVNRPVEAADLKLQLWPLRLRLAEVRVREDPAFAGEEFLRARGVEFDLGLWSLLRGQPEVLGLELDQPTLYLRQNPDGVWNVASVATPEEGAAAAPAPAGPPVRNWGMREGTLVVERAGPEASGPLRLSGVEVAVKEFSATRAFPFTLGVSFSPESRLSARGRFGPFNATVPIETPLEAELKLEKFRPAALGALVRVPPALAWLGALDGTASVKSDAGGARLEGTLQLLGRDAEGTMGLELAAAFPTDFSGVELARAALEAPGAHLKASGRVQFTPAEYALSLSATDTDIAALRALAPRLGFPLPAGIPPLTGKLTATLALSGTVEQWQLTGKAGGRDVTLPLAGAREPLRAASVELAFEPARVVAAPFALAVGSGLTLTVAASVEDYRGRPRLAARVSGGEVPLEALLALAKEFGKEIVPAGMALSGRVRPDLQLDGPLAEPARISYQGTLTLRELSLATPQLLVPVRASAVELALDSTRLSAPPFAAQIGDKLRAQVRFRLENYQTAPRLEVQLTTEQAELEALVGLARSLGADPLPGGRAAGRVTATVDLSGLLGEAAPPLAIRAQAQLAGATLQPATLRAPLTIEQASVQLSRERIELTNLRAAAAGGRFQGALRVQNFEAPQADFTLRGDTLDLEAVQALFAVPPATPPRRAALSPAVVHAQEKTNDWFARLSGRGRLDFERVRHGTLTLAPFGSPVAIANQIVTCDPLEFGLYDGGGRGRLAIDLRGAEPAVEFDGLIRGVDANKLLSENTDSKNRLYGRLGGTVAARFTGSERARISRTATGKGQLTLVNGRLGQINLAREVVAVGELVGLRYAERDTPIEDMSTDFEIGDGWVRTADLTMRTPDLTMNAAGGFSFAEELAFEATATFTPEATQRMSSRSPLGALAGGLLTDEQGRAVVPFNIRGSFAQPKFSLDVKRLAEMRLRRGRAAPAGNVRDILERLLKRRE
jgi:uncharacterized protein involved in outer membrane biogenesis